MRKLIASVLLLAVTVGCTTTTRARSHRLAAYEAEQIECRADSWGKRDGPAATGRCARDPVEGVGSRLAHGVLDEAASHGRQQELRTREMRNRL